LADSLREIRADFIINNTEVATAEYAEVRDPGRLDSIVGKVALGSAKEVDQAVRAAHQAFQSWRKLDAEQRISQV